MKRFLVDANLPSNIDSWKTDEFLFVNDIDSAWTDTEIWRFAASHDLTIISKDADFSHRIIGVSPPPRVIHLKIGNMRLKQFAAFIDRAWNTIEAVARDHKLVNVFADRIEGVN
jgi:predicted nuclease of predicted toxin-antitoxin system